MSREYPVKKTFEQDFLMDGKVFSVRYEQATIAEFFESIAKTPEERAKDALSLVIGQFPATLWEKICRKLFGKYLSRAERYADLETVALSVIANRFRWYSSAFDGKTSGKAGKPSKWLLSVSVMKVCGHYSVSPSELFENHTLEQFFWMLEGVRYWENAQTKEGAKLNDYALQDREGAKERAKATREAFEKAKI